MCPKVYGDSQYSICQHSKKLKHSQCASTGDQLNRRYSVHTVEYCATVTKTKIALCILTWKDDYKTMLGLENQFQNNVYGMIQLMFFNDVYMCT